MGVSKNTSFSDEHQRLAQLAKAMGHPARIAILEFLAANDSCVCGDIVKELPLSQSTVSQHLKELKQAGLIKGTIEGPKVCYCLDMTTMQIVQDSFSSIVDQLKTKNYNCC